MFMDESKRSSSITESADVLVDENGMAHVLGREKGEEFVDGQTAEQVQPAGSTSDPYHIPDGGLRAWLVVLASACATFTTFGFINAWGVFQTYYEQTLLQDQSPSTIAWIGSIQYALVFMTGIPTGRIFDKGYLRLPLAISSAFLITATFLVAECTQYWQFLLCQGFAIGLSCGFIMGPMVNVISQWFTTKRGIAFGLVGVGSSCGGVIFPIAARKLIPEVGFPWTMRIIGFIQIATLLVTNAATGRHLPVRKTLPPLSLHVFRNPAFGTYCAAGLITFLGLYTVLTYIDLSARAAGLDEDFSFYLVAIANAGSTLGRAGAGLISDRIGPLNIMSPATLVAGVLTYAWPFAKSKGAFVVVALIYGAASGAFVALFGAPLVEMGDLQDFGTRMGYFLTIMSFGALAGPPISGAINQRTGGFELVGVYAGTAVVASVGFMLMARYFVIRCTWGKA